MIQLRLTLRELYYDDISDDEDSDDEISYDEVSHDEISDDEFSDDEISGNLRNIPYPKIVSYHDGQKSKITKNTISSVQQLRLNL